VARHSTARSLQRPLARACHWACSGRSPDRCPNIAARWPTVSTPRVLRSAKVRERGTLDALKRHRPGITLLQDGGIGSRQVVAHKQAIGRRDNTGAIRRTPRFQRAAAVHDHGLGVFPGSHGGQRFGTRSSARLGMGLRCQAPQAQSTQARRTGGKHLATLQCVCWFHGVSPPSRMLVTPGAVHGQPPNTPRTRRTWAFSRHTPVLRGFLIVSKCKTFVFIGNIRSCACQADAYSTLPNAALTMTLRDAMTTAPTSFSLLRTGLVALGLVCALRHQSGGYHRHRRGGADGQKGCAHHLAQSDGSRPGARRPGKPHRSPSAKTLPT
jgi:hypothetical protein